jgi:hypothetical protein
MIAVPGSVDAPVLWALRSNAYDYGGTHPNATAPQVQDRIGPHSVTAGRGNHGAPQDGELRERLDEGDIRPHVATGSQVGAYACHAPGSRDAPRKLGAPALVEGRCVDPG